MGIWGVGDWGWPEMPVGVRVRAFVGDVGRDSGGSGWDMGENVGVVMSWGVRCWGYASRKKDWTCVLGCGWRWVWT